MDGMLIVLLSSVMTMLCLPKKNTAFKEGAIHNLGRVVPQQAMEALAGDLGVFFIRNTDAEDEQTAGRGLVFIPALVFHDEAGVFINGPFVLSRKFAAQRLERGHFDGILLSVQDGGRGEENCNDDNCGTQNVFHVVNQFC
jgi:hypothetical protein